jgi:hypothetical protein
LTENVFKALFYTIFYRVKRMKRILSLFIAAIIVCIALPVTASADYDYTLTLTGGESANILVTTGKYLITSSGTVTLGADITVNIGSDAEVIWEANVAGTHKVTFAGDGTAIITGSITSSDASINASAVHVNGVNLEMQSGKIESTGNGAYGLYVTGSSNVTISGGEILATGNADDGVNINSSSALVTVTGGTISGTRSGILLNAGTLRIAPTASTPVLIKAESPTGTRYPIYIGGNDYPDYPTVAYYYASANFDGTDKVLYNHSVDAFSPSASYQYVQFFAVNPEPPVVAEPEKPDTGVPPHLVTSNIPDGYKPVFPEITPIYEHSLNIDVIAIINKSGSVDSGKTRIEIIKAARTPGVTQITLILPEGCKGISAAAIKKSLAAAGNKKLFLSYDDTTIRLTSKTGQVLTKLYYNA